jgi:hypothetical protein
VEALGGELEIDSPRGKGTLLRVRVPLGATVAGGTPGVAAGKPSRSALGVE